LVEFAIVLIPLSLFLFGLIQFGLAFDQKQSINSAAREGARLAAVPHPANTVSAIRATAQSSFGSVTTATLTTNVFLDASTTPLPNDFVPCAGNEGHRVVVVSTTVFVITIPVWGTEAATLTGRGEFRCERAA
jgi:Flp pilus assembly protein TadG